MKWSNDEIELLKQLYPDNDNEYLEKVFSRPRRHIVIKANSIGLKKSKAQNTLVAKKAAQKMWESIDDRHEFCKKRGIKTGITLAKMVRSERRRLTFGLEQKTKMKVVDNPRMRSARYLLIHRNNYFTDGTDGSTEFYYDEHTFRSLIKEKRYSRFFTFTPADGFDEKDSVFVSYRKSVETPWNEAKVST